jgi:hypothetical protein
MSRLLEPWGADQANDVDFVVVDPPVSTTRTWIFLRLRTEAAPAELSRSPTVDCLPAAIVSDFCAYTVLGLPLAVNSTRRGHACDPLQAITRVSTFPLILAERIVTVPGAGRVLDVLVPSTPPEPELPLDEEPLEPELPPVEPPLEPELPEGTGATNVNWSPELVTD